MASDGVRFTTKNGRLHFHSDGRHLKFRLQILQNLLFQLLKTAPAKLAKRQQSSKLRSVSHVFSVNHAILIVILIFIPILVSWRDLNADGSLDRKWSLIFAEFVCKTRRSVSKKLGWQHCYVKNTVLKGEKYMKIWSFAGGRSGGKWK